MVARHLTVCPILILHIQLAKTKVAKRNVSAVIKKDVFGLKIAIDDLEPVQALQSTKQLCCVETRTVDIETLLPLKVMEQLTTVDERQNKIQFFG